MLEMEMQVSNGETAFELGFYWVEHNGQTLVAEWCDTGNGWEWSFTQGEVAKRVDRIIRKIVCHEPS
jgi:hypothetical protein